MLLLSRAADIPKSCSSNCPMISYFIKSKAVGAAAVAEQQEIDVYLEHMHCISPVNQDFPIPAGPSITCAINFWLWFGRPSEIAEAVILPNMDENISSS